MLNPPKRQAEVILINFWHVPVLAFKLAGWLARKPLWLTRPTANEKTYSRKKSVSLLLALPLQYLYTSTWGFLLVDAANAFNEIN
jgi:hypothetical protein